MEELQQLDQLSALIASAPEEATGEAGGVWDSLVNILKGVFQKILDSVINPLKTQVTNVYEYLKNKFTDTINQVKGAVNDAIAGVKEALTAAKDTIVSEVRGIVDDVIQGVNNVLGDIGDAIKQAIQWVVDKLDDVVNSIKNIGATIGKVISEALGDIAKDIREGIEDAINGISEFLGGIVIEVRDYIHDLIEGIKEWISTVVNNAKDWIKGVYDSVSDYIKGLIETLKAAYESAKQTIEDKLQLFLNWLIEVRDRLTSFFWDQMQKLGDFLAKEVLPRIGGAIEGAKALTKWAEKVWSLIKAGKWDQAFDLTDDLFKGLGIPAPIETLHAVLSAIAYFWETIRLQFVPLEVAAAKRANISLALDPTNVSDAAIAVFRGKASKDEFYANAALAGITKARADLSFEASKALPTPGAIQEGFLRGEISEKEHDKLLAGYGYTDKHIELFKALYFLIPTPNDLIRMSVREVFSPEIAEKFGQFEDFPAAFTEWAAKIGINEQWAKNYWAAHWDLPSATMGFEMLHRRIIDENELKLLLRALDVMPYWRERVIALSYNPITRVDLRRMYKMGVIDEKGVYEGYLDLGYNPEKAQMLTEFTKRYSAPEDESEQDQFRAMARTVYSAAYKKKLISQIEYNTFLVNMGYNPDDVTLLIQIDDYAIQQADKLFDLGDYRKDLQKLALTAYNRGLLSVDDIAGVLQDLGYEDPEITLELSLSDYNRQLKLRDLITGQLHDQYIEYLVDLRQLHIVLDMFGFRAAEVDKLVEEWDIERNFRTKRPPLADLRRFLAEGLITLEDFLDELRGQGYHEKYIALYQVSMAKG